MSLQANFSISSYLAAGACLQSVLFLVLPTRVALLPALILLLVRLGNGFLVTKGYMHNPYMPHEDQMRKKTAPILDENGLLSEKGGDKGLLVFVIGASSNHPFGLFAPGFKQLGDYFDNMWLDTEQDREKWGCIGKTASMPLGNAGGGTSLVTISYWKSREHLHAFAHAPLHKEGWDWFYRVHKSYPHIGIMHETYDVPPGGYENVYHSIWPIGMGNLKYPVKDKDSGETRETIPLIDASKGRWDGMLSRMAQKEIVEA